MYVEYDNGKHVRGWQVGEPLPHIEGCPYKIQASEDELDYILTRFSNIPSCKKQVIIWTGEIANFIWDNL